MFDTTHTTPGFLASSRADALETWRDAADLVRLRWHVFIEAGSANRSSAFAAYVAALDAEEAAAAEMTLLSDLAA
jgi:hypothetical protein